MFLGLAKLIFESDADRTFDRKNLAALAEKLRSRYRLCVRVDENGLDNGEPSIVIALLQGSKEKLSQQMDDIAKLCEHDGFGRISQEIAVIEHVDYFFDSER